MSKMERITSEIEQLPPKELTAFREWFLRFDAIAWDRQFESDVKTGKLDKAANRALRHHDAGRSTKL
jgi:hypothetical protein